MRTPAAPSRRHLRGLRQYVAVFFSVGPMLAFCSSACFMRQDDVFSPNPLLTLSGPRFVSDVVR